MDYEFDTFITIKRRYRVLAQTPEEAQVKGYGLALGGEPPDNTLSVEVEDVIEVE